MHRRNVFQKFGFLHRRWYGPSKLGDENSTWGSYLTSKSIFRHVREQIKRMHSSKKLHKLGKYIDLFCAKLSIGRGAISLYRTYLARNTVLSLSLMITWQNTACIVNRFGTHIDICQPAKSGEEYTWSSSVQHFAHFSCFNKNNNSHVSKDRSQSAEFLNLKVTAHPWLFVHLILKVGCKENRKDLSTLFSTNYKSPQCN